MTERLPQTYSRVRARLCAVCKHPQLNEIESSLLDGTSYKAVTDAHGISAESLRNHVRRHLPAALEAGFEGREMARVHSLANRVEILHVYACDTLTRAAAGTVLERVAAINATIGTLTLLGRLTGKLVGSGVNEMFARLGVRDEAQLRGMLQVARANVNMSTEDHILNGVEIILAGLPDKPELREEVAAKLERVLRSAPAELPRSTNGSTNGGH